MPRRLIRGPTAGLIASSVVVALGAGAKALGLVSAAPFELAYGTLLGSLGLDGLGLQILAAAISVLGGLVWGVLYNAMVRRSTILTGMGFGLLATLWLWLVAFPLSGRPLQEGLDPHWLAAPLVFNALLWGPLLGWLARPLKTPRSAFIF